MKRIKYIQSLDIFLIQNPEIITQDLLPKCIDTELYYFQRFHEYELL